MEKSIAGPETPIQKRSFEIQRMEGGVVEYFTITAVSGEPGAFQVTADNGKNQIDLFVVANDAGRYDISLKGRIVDPTGLINRIRLVVSGIKKIDELVGKTF